MPTQRHFALAEFERYEKDWKIIFATPRGYEVEGNKNIAPDEATQKITEDLRLDYDPKFSINENDFLEVRHAGNIFKLVAGVEFKYLTHTELSCRRRKEGGWSEINESGGVNFDEFVHRLQELFTGAVNNSEIF